MIEIFMPGEEDLEILMALAKSNEQGAFEFLTILQKELLNMMTKGSAE